jgi:outer membrane protein OmpA-like peptidoglycan-associated protein
MTLAAQTSPSTTTSQDPATAQNSATTTQTTTTTTTTNDTASPDAATQQPSNTATTQQDSSTQSSQDTSAQQDAAAQQQHVEPMDKTPLFRVNVVQRTTRAVNYRNRGGSTKIDFRGTDLMPQATGDAKVDGKAGRLEVKANFNHMVPANTFGPEYLTYVLWAITPEGRALNLGEVLLDKDKAWTTVTTDLQNFGMIVTAEPYFAVTRPSNLVVMENIVRQDTAGNDYPIDAKFDALDRGAYTVDIPAANLPSRYADPHTPLELIEARNAVAIARADGADKYAPDALAKAEKLLAQGETYLQQKQGRTPIGTVARAATQAAEDARVLTIRRQGEERIAAERRAAQQREDEARAQAQAARERAEQAKQQADAEAARRAQAEADRAAAEQARAEADRARAEAQAAAEQARLEQQKAEEARQAAIQQQQLLAAQAQQAQQTAQQAQQERDQMRQRLLTQLNQVLQTRDTARGLIVNMSDVLFDTGKATLRPGARERLAKVAGIVLAYPDLHLEVDGHTDNVGSDAYNMRLSDARANAVRDYLAKQGVPMNNLVAKGFGKTEPIASNATAAGRQQNRRVELIVSGEAIGTAVGPAFRINGQQSTGASINGTGGTTGAATGTAPTSGVNGSVTGGLSSATPNGGVTGTAATNNAGVSGTVSTAPVGNTNQRTNPTTNNSTGPTTPQSPPPPRL